MKIYAKLFITIISFFLVLSFPTNYVTNATEPAVKDDTFFIPMRAGEKIEQGFTYKNTSKMQSKIYLKFIEKDLPKGEEEKWFAGSCYDEVYPTQELEQWDIILRPGQKTYISVCFRTDKEVALNKEAKFVLEINPLKDPNNKTSITFYAVCLPPKEILLTVGEKVATVNGESIFLDAPVFVSIGRTFVPLRFIGECFGSQIKWDSITKKISLVLFDLELDFLIGKEEMQIKIGCTFNRTFPIEAPPVLVSNRTFVPLRIVSEILGAEVKYNSSKKLITILFPPIPEKIN